MRQIVNTMRGKLFFSMITAGIFTGIVIFSGCKKQEDTTLQDMLTLFALGQNQSSGYMILIPDGLAK